MLGQRSPKPEDKKRYAQGTEYSVYGVLAALLIEIYQLSFFLSFFFFFELVFIICYLLAWYFVHDMSAMKCAFGGERRRAMDITRRKRKKKEEKKKKKEKKKEKSYGPSASVPSFVTY